MTNIRRGSRRSRWNFSIPSRRMETAPLNHMAQRCIANRQNKILKNDRGHIRPPYLFWDIELGASGNLQPTIILKRRVAGCSQRSLAEFVSAAGRAVKLRGTASVLLTGNREMRSLN